MTQSKEAVFFCDGSAIGNPGYGGYGVYGYTYRLTESRSKNIKYPVKPEYYMTTTGISTSKDTLELEVLDIYEIIKSINSSTATNNDSELLAFLTVLKKIPTIENLTKITIYTDSNYIVSGYNDFLSKWKENGYRRSDGTTLTHKENWIVIDKHIEHIVSTGIDLSVLWVKGHSDSICNNIADLYSRVGSNNSKLQLTSSSEFNETILDSVLSYKEYKKSFTIKDVVLQFRELYFSSSDIDDINYCFLTSSSNDTSIGKRDTASIFAANVGYVPPFINKLKSLFRSVDRTYNTICCIKLSKLDNKEICRLMTIVDPILLLTKTTTSRTNSYTIISDTTPFIYENTTNYPFIMDMSRIFSRLMDTETTEYDTLLDITDSIVSNKTLVLNIKQSKLDYTERVPNISLLSKLILTVGYDIPNYNTLKSLEKDIVSVTLRFRKDNESSYYTAYTTIETNDRKISTVNILNKYMSISSRN